MKTAVSKPLSPKPVLVDLREALDMSAATVDRSASIIRNVKICGKSSQNRHGMPGVTGTDYLPSFHAAARPLYENLEVNVGHPPKATPDAERDPKDRNGVLFNTRIVNNETFGDWQLIPSHAMTPVFLDCAENPRLHGQFALSHNAQAYGVVRNGRYQIAEPGKVRSVDAVTRGGCNRSFFESLETTMQIPLATVLESADAETQVAFAELIELYEDLGPMPIDAPSPAEGSEKPGYMEHLGEMVKAILMDDKMDIGEKTKRILSAMKVARDCKPKDMPESLEAAAATAAAEAAAAVITPAALPAKDADELATLRKDRAARDVCESLEFFDATPIQIKAIAGLETAVDRKALAKSFKEAKAPPKRSTQAHTASGRTGKTVLEGAEPARKSDKKAFAESILK